MLEVRVGRVMASLNQQTDCEQALLRAERFMSRATGNADPDWARYFDEFEYCAQVGSCYALLGRPARSAAWLNDALQAHEGGKAKDRATYHIWRAETSLALGEVEQAVDEVRSVFPDVLASRSRRSMHRVNGFVHQLEAVDSSASTSLRDFLVEDTHSHA